MKRVSRRDFLQLSSGATLSISLLGRYASGAEGKEKGPNLLILFTDEHNFRTLGCYRKTLPPELAYMWGKDAVVETPNLDWLADNGHADACQDR